jgi:hypothetical protein
MMPKHFRVPHGLARILAPGLLLAFVVLGSPGSLFGQIVTGFDLQKTCPSNPVDPGSSFDCTYILTNQGTNGVINLAVTNQAPFSAAPGCPGCGPIVPIQCLQAGNPVTTLGPSGSATDTCNGSATETAPGCGSTSIFFADRIAASGNDAVVTTLPVSASATNAVVVLACTPTPTPTPTNTPIINPPTETPANTPTNTNTPMEGPPPPPVPTLSFPMMVLLGLLLAGTGLFLARRQ